MQPGLPDMQMLLQQVQQMQEEMSATEVTGQAGNGLVEITTTAPLQTSGLEIIRVRIDPKVVDPGRRRDAAGPHCRRPRGRHREGP